MKKKVKLLNHSFNPINYGKEFVMKGEVIGHKNFNNGTIITTSKVLKIDMKKQEVETLNTIYMIKI